MVFTVWRLKVRKAADMVTGCTPAPLKLTTCGLLRALSEIVNKPVLVAMAVGVKLTLTVQLPEVGKVTFTQLLD